MKSEEIIKKVSTANVTFTPGSPISQKALFADRIEHVLRVAETITRPGQHAIMFGERGVGKTSLANVIHSFLPKNKAFNPIKVNCSNGLTFTELWRGIFRDIQLGSVAAGLVPVNDEINAVLLHFIDQDNPVEMTPIDVRFILSQLPFQNTIIIIDEFDRATTDDDMVSKMVDTIKTLSDYTLPVTIVLVAVGDSVEQLIKEHSSLSRALVQIPLPRMSELELEDIVEKGMARLEMTIESDVKKRIIKLSQGLPHYTHLLSLEAVTSAIKSGRTNVEIQDLEKAIEIAIKKTQESTIRTYYKAVTAPRGVLYTTILLGCALAKTDMRGYFSPADVKRALFDITGEDYSLARFTRHLRQFATDEKGSVLIETGTKGQYKYHFVDPMMEPFLIIKAISEHKISPDILFVEK